MKNLRKNTSLGLLLITLIVLLQEERINSRDQQTAQANVALVHGIMNAQAKKLPLHEIVLNQDYTTEEKLKLIQDVLDNDLQEVNAQDKDGKTALNLITFYKGDPALAQLLIVQYKADVNRPDRFNVSPLHNALEKEEIEIARMLLEAGADRNLKNDADEITPMDLARSPKTIALLGLEQ